MNYGSPPLRERSKNDIFSQPEVLNDLSDFSFDYFYTGERVGSQVSNEIELSVVTYIIDFDDNIYIRICTYSGAKQSWKQVIEKQLRNLMQDINIGSTFIKGKLRFFEVDQEHYLTAEKFEQRFLDLKAKL